MDRDRTPGREGEPLGIALGDVFTQILDLPFETSTGPGGRRLRSVRGVSAGSTQVFIPPSCYTIGIDTPQEMVRKMHAMPDWPIYKIKLDARGGLNGAWPPRPQAVVFASTPTVHGELKTLPATINGHTGCVELIEQPLPSEA